MSIWDKLMGPNVRARDPQSQSLDPEWCDRVLTNAAANRLQRLQYLNGAAPKDIEDLIPILQERLKEATRAQQRAMDELADALMVSEFNRERRRV